MIKKIHTTPQFIHKFKQLDKSVRIEVIEEIQHFKSNPLDPSFGIHPLKKEFKGFHAFSLAPNLRIIFKFIKNDFSEIVFYDIGPHEIYLN